jgi:hypothetical protein
LVVYCLFTQTGGFQNCTRVIYYGELSPIDG